MKEKLAEKLKETLINIGNENNVDLSDIKIEIKENRDKDFGDFSSNAAMVCAKKLSLDPNNLARVIVKSLEGTEELDRLEIAGPGFINFFIKPSSRFKVLEDILLEGDGYGLKKQKDPKKILIEYVSSNPTGPLHIGHGRGAAFGSVLANLLRANGNMVDEEYYVNDHGRQMDILAVSVLLRYIQLNNIELNYPDDCYQGDYIVEIAKEIYEKSKNKLVPSNDEFFELVKKAKNSEEALDKIISFTKEDKQYQNLNTFKGAALNKILSVIKDDLEDFGVHHNSWFHESSLYKEEGLRSKIDQTLNALSKNNYIYEKDGAIWFKSTEFGDDKDRVVKRGNEDPTYFASDIAYHLDKYERKYDRIINVWGSDHHGYLPRVKASVSALNQDEKKLEVIFIQFANLVRSGEKISMSTRGGEFIKLRDLIKEVGSNAARFFYINRKGDQHLDFDLDLAKEQSKDNPLFYIQYAHARVCSVMKKLNKDQKLDINLAKENLSLLIGEKEINLQKQLAMFPEVVERSSAKLEPHTICYYLKDLASVFHSYYNDEKIITDDKCLLQAKLLLINSVRQVIKNGLGILGIEAPEIM